MLLMLCQKYFINKILCVTVLVATIEPATSREQSKLVDDKNHDRQFFSIQWERRKKKRKGEHQKLSFRSVEHIAKSFLKNYPTPSIELCYNHSKTYQRQYLNFSDAETFFIF